MAQHATVEALIVGGGHAGLLLGTALAHAGIGVGLIERQPQEAIAEAPADGRTLALLAGSVAIVRRVGAWRRVAPVAEPIGRVEVSDVDGGGQVHYDSAAHGKGPFGVGVEQTMLRKALLQAFVDHAGPQAYLRDEVATLRRERDATMLTLASGRRIGAPLVVGADGRASRIRELARIAVDRWAYDQRALTMVLRHESPHGGMAANTAASAARSTQVMPVRRPGRGRVASGPPRRSHSRTMPPWGHSCRSTMVRARWS